MKLISAPGSRDMQRAIASPLVQNSAEGMLEIKDKPVLLSPLSLAAGPALLYMTILGRCPQT